MNENCRQLKNYKGMSIYKSWTEIKGKQYNIVYDAYYIKDESYFDSCKNLKVLKKAIDNYAN